MLSINTCNGPCGTDTGRITGKVTLSPDHLIAAGADFPLRLVGASPTLPYSHARPAMVFAVTRAMNPVLLNGNRLCGPTAPTWIVAVPIDPGGLEIAVFTGPRVPRRPAPEGSDSGRAGASWRWAARGAGLSSARVLTWRKKRESHAR